MNVGQQQVGRGRGTRVKAAYGPHAVAIGILVAVAGCSSGESASPIMGGAGESAPPAATSGSGGAGTTAASSGTGASGTSAAGRAAVPSAGAGVAGTGAAGTPGTPPAAGGGAGAAAGTAAPAAAGAGGGGGQAAGGTGASMPDPGTGMRMSTLPMIDNPGGAGPFQVQRVATAEGLSSHGLFIPSEVGTNGKNPVVVWTCGNGGTISFYTSFLEHLASHGFFIVADKGSSSDRLAEVESQNDAIAWVLSENGKAGGTYSGKLDVDNIAVMGHSLGSLASFATAAMNEHVRTSVHYSGGLTGNPVGFDMSWLASMTKPAAFLCGANDTTAGPACKDDFASAPAALPVFYGTLAGADHLGPFALSPRGGEYGRAGVAWLRWKLAGDETFKSWFSGASCELCSSPWTGMSKNLE